jgi:aminoglycoside phosphotransferase (APT) family kinase protein
LRSTLDCETSRLDDILNSVTPDDRPKADTLVHGDLYSRHLLVDADLDLCGVIDWGDCHIGDRAVDLLPVYTMLPPDARERFFERYGRVDESTDRIARARALYHTLVVFNYAREILDSGLEREALYGISNLACARSR